MDASHYEDKTTPIKKVTPELKEHLSIRLVNIENNLILQQWISFNWIDVPIITEDVEILELTEKFKNINIKALNRVLEFPHLLKNSPRQHELIKNIIKGILNEKAKTKL